MSTRAHSATAHVLPPQALLDLAGGTGSNPLSYLTIGYNVSETIRRVLSLVHPNPSDFGNVLDFGCGCGRVLRWVAQWGSPSKLYGTDVSSEAIDWCKRNMPFARFSCNGPSPPLPFPNDTFDFVYGVSVLTHLDETYQFAWLEELRRIVKPGGIVMLSVHGECAANLDLPPEELARYLNEGFLFRMIHDPDASGLPPYYQLTYHSRAYVERIWTKFFTLHAYVQRGAFAQQELLVLEKPPSGQARKSGMAPYIYLGLPNAWLDVPTLGTLSLTDELVVSGWAFQPTGERVELDVWMDGRRVASCTAGMPRPAVAAIYGQWPSAHESGFAATVSTKGLQPGRHVLSISARTNLVPTMCAYFVQGSDDERSAAAHHASTKDALATIPRGSL